MKSPAPEALCAKGVFQIQTTIPDVNFSNNILTQLFPNAHFLYPHVFTGNRKGALETDGLIPHI